MSNTNSGGEGGAVAEQLALMQKMMEEQERRLMQQQEQVREQRVVECLSDFMPIMGNEITIASPQVYEIVVHLLFLRN